MSYLLHIETSTPTCSVALSKFDELLDKVSDNEGNSHARVLSDLSQLLLKRNNLSFADLAAVSVSKGPGSYTGLRIGVSFAKGICYSLEIPLISVSTLKGMAIGAINRYEVKTDLLCPMIDARRMEVYSMLTNNKMDIIEDVSAEIITETSYKDFLEKYSISFFGTGALKCMDTIKSNNAKFVNNFIIDAEDMISLAFNKFKEKDFEDVAYFEPFYLKDFVAIKPKNKVF